MLVYSEHRFQGIRVLTIIGFSEGDEGEVNVHRKRT